MLDQSNSDCEMTAARKTHSNRMIRKELPHFLVSVSDSTQRPTSNDLMTYCCPEKKGATERPLCPATFYMWNTSHFP